MSTALIRCTRCQREQDLDEFAIPSMRYLSEWCADCRKAARYEKSSVTQSQRSVERRTVLRSGTGKPPNRDWLTPLNHLPKEGGDEC